MYKTKHFKLYELLPREFYERHKHEEYRLWLMFDARMLWTADRLWDLYGPTVIANDWYWKGGNQYRGWRPWDCKVGSEFSQHKFGRALDQKFKHATAEEVRRDIRNNPWQNEFRYITALEDKVKWLHFDVRNFLKSKYGILIIKP